MTQCGGFQFLLILDQWGMKVHAVVVFGLGKNLLFKSVLGRCGKIKITSEIKLPLSFKKGIQGIYKVQCTVC